LNQYEENHYSNENGIDDPESEVADSHALTVLLQDGEHQNTVGGIANDGHQPEYRGESQ
jgi:hypothetical protein